ncbi:MAG: hypothetical protein AAF502_09795 [Bacteroidota bacterium]
MTLQEFFDALSANPIILLLYFIALPLTALLVLFLGKGEGHKSPWRNVYCVLIYLACIPGVFALTLNVYLFLFERQSVMQMGIYTQVLPIISMILTLYFIRQNVSFQHIPGFDKLSSFLFIMAALIGMMWFFDRMHIIGISFIPFHFVIIGFLVLLLIIVFGIRKVFN